MPTPWILGLSTVLALPPAPANPSDTLVVVEPPPFHVLRFEEDWSVLTKGAWDDPMASLKFVPLAGRDRARLTLGGQVRFRSEGVVPVDSDAAGVDRDAFHLVRVLLHGDLHLGGGARIFVEGKHAAAYGRNLPGGRRPVDHDELDLQNAFLELRCCGEGRATVLRTGRQELLLARQRLVSPLDWANTRRTFQGATLRTSLGGGSVEAFWTRPVQVRQTRSNRGIPGHHFYGVAAHDRWQRPGLGWTAYVLGLRQTRPISFAGLEGTQRRLTLGGLTTWTLGSTGTRFEVEGARQVGTLADRTIRAGFVAFDMTQPFGSFPWQPALTVGLDRAGGNSDPDGSTWGTFHQLYPLGHAYNGFVDVVGRQNLVEARAVVTARPAGSVQARFAGHSFRRAARADGIYAVTGGLLVPPAPEAARFVGRELNGTVTWQANRHTRLEGGYGRFSPGASLEGAAVPRDWGYLTLIYTF